MTRVSSRRDGQASFSDSRWGAVVVARRPAPVVAQNFQPIRVNEILKPRQSRARRGNLHLRPWTEHGRLGGFMFRARLNQSRIRFARCSNRMASSTPRFAHGEATDTYILRGKGKESFEPHFISTVSAMSSLRLPGNSTSDAIEGVVFYTRRLSHAVQHGKPDCEPVVEQHSLGTTRQLSECATDCPQRDERLGGWAMRKSSGERLPSTRTCRFFPQVTPTFVTRKVRPARSRCVSARWPHTDSVAGWADAGVIIPWSAYLQFRDTRLLEGNWPRWRSG